MKCSTKNYQRDYVAKIGFVTAESGLLKLPVYRHRHRPYHFIPSEANDGEEAEELGGADEPARRRGTVPELRAEAVGVRDRDGLLGLVQRVDEEQRQVARAPPWIFT